MSRLLPPLALLLTACAEPAPPRTPGDPLARPFDAASALRSGHHIPLPDALREARRGPPPPTPEVDLMSAIGGELSGGEFDDSLGGPLLEALAEQPPEDVEAWGAGALTVTELVTGSDPLCEDPHARFRFEEDGVSWELDMRLFAFLQLTSPLQALFMELSEGCAAGVAAAAGDVDLALSEGSCTEAEARAFFPEGGACRECVSALDVADCQGLGECAEEAPLQMEEGGEWLEWAQAEALACAPDVRVQLFMGARDIQDDGTLPESWNQTDWPRVCFAVRDEATGEIGLSFVGDSDGYEEITDGYGDGIIGRLGYLREEGETGTPHADRVTYARRLGFADGTTIDTLILSFGGTGQISAPLYPQDKDGDGDVDDDDWGYGYGGWGWGPTTLRPDGTDPTDVNDTYARDWAAGVVTKMSTTRDGVPINDMNYSRCEEWAGPHEDGSWTCLSVGKPKIGYFVDNHVFWYNRAHTMVDVRPLITLGSTGLPDDDMPGGVTPHMAGSDMLASEEWDGCAWPNRLVPDHMRTEDEPDVFGGQASLDADTYKFGKDPDQDIRMVLATTQKRGFCPPEAE